MTAAELVVRRFVTCQYLTAVAIQQHQRRGHGIEIEFDPAVVRMSLDTPQANHQGISIRHQFELMGANTVQRHITHMGVAVGSVVNAH